MTRESLPHPERNEMWPDYWNRLTEGQAAELAVQAKRAKLLPLQFFVIRVNEGQLHT